MERQALKNTGETLEGIANTVIQNNTAKLSKADGKDVAKQMKEDILSWNEKVERGKELNPANMPADLVRTIVLGQDGKSGLAKLLHDKGERIHSKKKVADLISNVARFIPDEDLADINKAMSKYTNIQLGELTQEGKLNLRDLIAKEASEAGKGLAVFSQAKSLVNTGIVAAGGKNKKTIEEEMEEALNEVDKLKKAEPLKYGQSVWKRLLVSSPATTMINVAGFSQYYVGQTMADLFNSGMLGMKAMAQMAYSPEAARATMRQARALTAIQAQKMRN